MPKYKVLQYKSLCDAVHALTDGVNVFAIDLDSFEKIQEIEFHTYNDLLNLSLGHTLVFIGIIKEEEEFKF